MWGIAGIALAAALVVVAAQIVRLRRTEALHRTIQEAIRTGSPLAPELLARLSRDGDAVPHGWGSLFLAIAAAIVGFGLLQGDADDIRNTVSVALFPGAIGLVLALHDLRRRRGGPD